MNRARVLILALGLAFGAALPAQAAAIDDTLVACARQADNAKRLACYDNAVATLSVLSPLRQGCMADWDWPDRAIVESPESGQLVEDGWGSWSTFLDKVVIDHALVSPTLKAKAGAALIYAFDLDPALDEPPHPAGWLRQTTDYELIPCTWKPLQVVYDFYRVSDHRPVRISIAPA